MLDRLFLGEYPWITSERYTMCVTPTAQP